MGEHQLSLPDAIYQDLLAAASMEGVSPADWIAAHLPVTDKQQEFSPDVVADLIGSFDSRQHPSPSRPVSPSQQQSSHDVLQDVAGSIGAGDEPSPQDIKAIVGDAITAKLAKQGIQNL